MSFKHILMELYQWFGYKMRNRRDRGKVIFAVCLLAAAILAGQYASIQIMQKQYGDMGEDGSFQMDGQAADGRQEAAQSADSGQAKEEDHGSSSGGQRQADSGLAQQETGPAPLLSHGKLEPWQDLTTGSKAAEVGKSSDGSVGGNQENGGNVSGYALDEGSSSGYAPDEGSSGGYAENGGSSSGYTWNGESYSGYPETEGGFAGQMEPTWKTSAITIACVLGAAVVTAMGMYLRYRRKHMDQIPPLEILHGGEEPI